MQEGGEISDHSGALSREMGKEELNEGKETARNGRTGRVEPIVHLFQQSHTPVNVATTAKPIVSDESLFGQFTSPCSPRISIADRLRYRLLLIQKKKKEKNEPETFRKLPTKGLGDSRERIPRCRVTRENSTLPEEYSSEPFVLFPRDSRRMS